MSYFLVENAIGCCLQHYIQIEVWDYDTLNRDDFMGRLQIPLSLLSEETTACWYPLGRGSAKGNVHGEIFLELTLTASQVQFKLISVVVDSCSMLPATHLYCTKGSPRYMTLHDFVRMKQLSTARLVGTRTSA